MNFHAIGSGSEQAISTLLRQKHSKKDPLLSTVYTVYKAKRNAEVSQGVGKETELLILSQRRLLKLSDESLLILGKIYEEELQHGMKHKDLKLLNLTTAGSGGVICL